ncbi:hypothetical protein E4U22_001029 [Claviceps purpurea]|nr:hypothetical protein E4U10_006153 [Claviceps purpurea]KAG6313342.1 hypothetical protein E4U22_001029 [Claviceps purpurea]
MDHNWDQRGFENEDLKMTVRRIHVCVYSDVDDAESGDEELPPVNHWIIFLEIAARHSVRINMTPGCDFAGVRGQIEISTKRYMFTEQTVHLLTFPTRGEPKVEDIIKLIIANGLQKYDFTPEWEGCRFWTYTLISHLERKGLIEPGSTTRMNGSIPYYYISSTKRIYRESREGTFRSDESE